MAQQIKKKFIRNDAVDGSKIKLLDGQSLRVETVAGEVELLKLGANGEVMSKGSELAFKTSVDTLRSELEAAVEAEESARIAGDAGLQSEINALEDRVAETESDISVLQSQVFNSDADISGLETRITTAEGDITALELALATETSRAQSAEQALSGRVDVLEAKTFGKQKIVITTEFSYVDLEREVVANSLVVFVNRLGAHKDEDYTVSVVGGKTRLTWINSFGSAGMEAIEEGDEIFVTFYY